MRKAGCLVAAWLLWLAMPLSFAHEPVPAIAEVTLSANTVTVELRLPPELVSTTHESHRHGSDSATAAIGAEGRDALESPSMYTCADGNGCGADDVVGPRVSDILAGIRLRDDRGRRIPLLPQQRVPDTTTENDSSPTSIRLQGALPAGARALHWYWPAEFGTVVVRSPDDARATFAHVLYSGTESPPISLLGRYP